MGIDVFGSCTCLAEEAGTPTLFKSTHVRVPDRVLDLRSSRLHAKGALERTAAEIEVVDIPMSKEIRMVQAAPATTGGAVAGIRSGLGRSNERRRGVTLVLSIVNVALFVAIAVALARRYHQLGYAGFLWLTIPLALFPLGGVVMANWIRVSVDGLYATPSHVTFPFSLVESGRISLGSVLSLLNTAQHLVWSPFVLVGLFMFGRRQATTPRHEP